MERKYCYRDLGNFGKLAMFRSWLRKESWMVAGSGENMEMFDLKQIDVQYEYGNDHRVLITKLNAGKTIIDLETQR